MIVLKAAQEKILAALQSVGGIVERRHTLPILANVQVSPWIAATVAFSVYAGAFLGEIWRGCLQSIPRQQWEAGAALWDPQVLLFGLAVAAVSSAVPISLEMVALKRLPKEAFGIMISMEPAVAALLGLVLLGEHLSALQWVAIGCTMLAAAGSSVTAQR